MIEPSAIDASRRRHPSIEPVPQDQFAHPSERAFARLLNLYGFAWSYEPVEFPLEWNELGVESIVPKLPAFILTQISSATAITNMNGAPKACKWRIDSTPRHTTTMLSSQNPRKHAHRIAMFPAAPGQITTSIE